MRSQPYCAINQILQHLSQFTKLLSVLIYTTLGKILTYMTFATPLILNQTRIGNRRTLINTQPESVNLPLRATKQHFKTLSVCNI